MPGFVTEETIYFNEAGSSNTTDVVDILERAVKTGRYRHIVVPATEGISVRTLIEREFVKETKIAVVTHSAGYKEKNTDEFDFDLRGRCAELGIGVYTGTILTHSLETALSKKFQGLYPTMLISQTLRRFGEGAKVAVEIVMEACDGGLIPEDEIVLAVGGTSRGWDSILAVNAKASKRFLDLKVVRILAKPAN